jgi:hypothetical protein
VNKVCGVRVNVWVVSEWQSRATDGVVMSRTVVAQDNWGRKPGSSEAKRRLGDASTRGYVNDRTGSDQHLDATQ